MKEFLGGVAVMALEYVWAWISYVFAPSYYGWQIFHHDTPPLMCLKAAIKRPDAEKVKKANSGTDLTLIRGLTRFRASVLSPDVQKRCVLWELFIHSLDNQKQYNNGGQNPPKIWKFAGGTVLTL